MSAEEGVGPAVLIAGVGRHMGLAVGERLRRLGYHVAVSDLDWDTAADAASYLNQVRLPGSGPTSTSVIPIQADVRRPEECAEAVDSVCSNFGRIDALVSTVGRSSFGSSLDMTADLFKQELDSTVLGNFLISQAASRAMVASGRPGRIVIFSSVAAQRARRSGIAHSAAKAGVDMIIRVLAVELGEYGITVNGVAPGLVPREGHVSSPEYRKRVAGSLPLGRLGEAGDVVGAVSFLLSDDASWITGEIITVDGGATAGDSSVPPSVATPSSTY